MAVALFASRDKIHFFDDIGYQHDPYTHCTRNRNKWRKGRCSCEPSQSFGKYRFSPLRLCVLFLMTLIIIIVIVDYDGYSCKSQWDKFMQ